MPSQNDQVQYFRAQLVHRDAQFEHVCSELDTLRSNKLIAHMRLFSREAKEWESRVISETERAIEVQEAMDKQFQVRWRQAEAELRDLCQSNSVQILIFAARVRESELEHQQLHTAQKRDSCNLRHKPSENHKTWNNKHQA